jgi:endoglucanase
MGIMKFRNILLFLISIQTAIMTMAQSLNYDIRLNQAGFLPNAVKIAAVVNTQSDSFNIMTSDLSTTVFKGQFLPSAYYPSSDEDVSIADFTLMNDTGEYVLVVDDLGKSVPFSVKSDVFTGVSKAAIKAYYFNRASTPILSQYAGAYARAEGHPDTAVVVLPSAASAGRPAGTVISTPGGWYDAGDYNKYIVSSGISVFTLLSAYETYPQFYDTLNTNIPESTNDIPDILDEALWNIKWMMTMQDTDGGVYNKTTEANFSGFVMPDQVTSTRYVTAKSTAATLDFAAIMAMTARIYKKYDPELADTALNQAMKAWQWANEHPNIAFTNPGASGGYPAINTGEYGDNGFDDEFFWCASELYVTTKDSTYYNTLDFDHSFGLPGWPVVSTLGLLSMLVNKDSLTPVADIDFIKSKFLDFVSATRNNITTSPYRIPGDFYYWAGNNAFANWGMLFMQAFRLTGDASYFNAGLCTLDYLLGKNATTYCFVTGQGTKHPMHIHHRISSADGVVEPVPGLLVCGADAGDVSDCGGSSYPSTFPARSYLDAECSYSTNEVAIGINAPFAFLAGALQCEYLENFIDSMPKYFSISTNKITLPYKKGDDVQVVIESNTEWSLSPSAEWITISDTLGSGSTTVLVNSSTDNPTESERTGKINVYSQGSLYDSIMVTQNGVRKSFRIEAEDYLEMAGLQTETTADEGGGEDLGYVDAGDWATYSLDVTSAGYYDVTFRHAGYAGNFDVSLDDVFLQQVTFPATTDWQDWTSDTTQMMLPEGQQIMKLDFNAPGVNLNWMQFDWKGLTLVENPVSDNIKIYPVPADKYVTIDFGSEKGIVDIHILSIDGKTLLHKISKGITTEHLDVSGLGKGVYILKAKVGSMVYTKKLIIE